MNNKVVVSARFICLLCIFLTPFIAGANSANAKEERPNIVLILCDDMGWSDIGCYGGEVQTPNLDRLASEGLQFTQFYNNAKCTTTRASLVTGLYPRRKGSLLKRNMVTFGEVLQSAGYQTGLCGKWHLGSDANTHPYYRGFQEFYGLLDGACNYFNPSRPDPKYKGGKVRSFAHNDTKITEFPEDFYTTDAFTDNAIQMIRGSVKKDKPFLVHVTYNAPHYPLHARPEDIQKYIGKFRLGWEVMRQQRYARQLEMGLIDRERYKLSGTDSRSYDWATADQEFEDLRMAVYAAMIDRMDQNIGKLLKTLDELKVADNTLVMFFSDNGGCAEEPGGRDPKVRNPGPVDDYVTVGPAWGWAQNSPFRRYKTWMHEGGANTPCIVRWPGKVEPGSLTEEVGHIIDVMPTFCEIAGTNYPATFNGNKILPVEGKSLLPILKGGKRVDHERLFWEYRGNRAVRAGRWKLVWDSLTESWSLFDLDVDRTETQDLANRYPARVENMTQEWFAWAKRTGVKIKAKKKS